MQIEVRKMARRGAGGHGHRPQPDSTRIDRQHQRDGASRRPGRGSRAVRRQEIIAIHTRLMRHAPNKHLTGRIRTQQNWIGGNDYNPCGADFVPPPPTNDAEESGHVRADENTRAPHWRIVVFNSYVAIESGPAGPQLSRARQTLEPQSIGRSPSSSEHRWANARSTEGLAHL